MLFLSRCEGERVRITIGGVEVWVTVSGLSRYAAKLAFEAPPEVKIDREEVAQRKDWDLDAKRHKR